MHATSTTARQGDFRVSSPVAAMWIFMLVELMFFLALVSAASIVHAGAGDNWAGASFHGLVARCSWSTSVVCFLVGRWHWWGGLCC